MMDKEKIDIFFMSFIFFLAFVPPIYLLIKMKIEDYFKNYTRCNSFLSSSIADKVIFLTTWRKLVYMYVDYMKIEEEKNHYVIRICQKNVIVTDLDTIVLFDILF